LVDDDIIPTFLKPLGVHIDMYLAREAGLVEHGYKTEGPSESTFSNVVTCDSVRKAFPVANLNGLDSLTGYVQSGF
jgi:hypothetical protein